MISNKVYLANGINNRFLSDFIIRSNNYARPYVFIYDETLDPQGSEDTLQTPGSAWSYPSNLYRRGSNIAKSEDLVTTDKWQVVDNSILYYTAPPSGATVWVEVATTSEEFGTTLIAPAVERAETAAINAYVSALAAKASEDIALVSANASEASRLVSDANVLLTHADVVTTNSDVVTTHADVVLTGLDVDTANANVLLTNADVITATEQAAIAIAQAGYSLDQAGYSNTSSIASANSAILASEWADKATEVVTGRDSAKTWAGRAEASAVRAEQFDPDVFRAATPTFTIPLTVNEKSVTQGSIDLYDADITYIIQALNGTIEQSGGVFNYTAPDLIGGVDGSDTIFIYAIEGGKLQSYTTSQDLVIKFVPVIADTAYQIVDFTGQASFNDGFDLI